MVGHPALAQLVEHLTVVVRDGCGHAHPVAYSYQIVTGSIPVSRKLWFHKPCCILHAKWLLFFV